MTRAASSVHIGNSLQKALDNVFGYLPNIVGFLVILLLGYLIAKIVKAVVNKALARLKVDAALTNSHAGGFVEKVSPGGRPSRLVGGVAFWVIGKVLGSNRVSAEVEIAGLDVPEMGLPGYPEFIPQRTPEDVPQAEVAAAKAAVPALAATSST